MAEDGEVVYRMMQLAKERNISYEPSYDMRMALNAYRDRKGLPDPYEDGAQAKMIAAPVYNPSNNGGSGIPPQGGPPGGGGDFGQLNGVPQEPMQQPPQGPPPSYNPEPYMYL